MWVGTGHMVGDSHVWVKQVMCRGGRPHVGEMGHVWVRWATCG